MMRRISAVAICLANASSRSRVSSAIFLSLPDEGRLSVTFFALRRFGVTVLRRRALAGSRPGLERLLITT